MTFRVFSECHPYGWEARGLVFSNALTDKGTMVLHEYNRKTYTIPWRYFVNGLVYAYEETVP